MAVCVESSSREARQSLQKVELKIIVVGDSFVGKTSIISKYIKGGLDWSECGRMDLTIGVDYAKKEIVVDNFDVKLNIWDTGGQERHRSMVKNYFRNSDGVIAMYDVTNKNTLENLEYWVKMLDGEQTNPVIIIVGNKIDLENREVTRSEGLQFAKERGALYMETSFIISQGVRNVFEKLTRKILRDERLWRRREELIQLRESSVNDIPYGENILNCFCS